MSEPVSKSFDYRSMLVRYLTLVGEQEGIDYLSEQDGRFTPEEMEEMQRLLAEAGDH
ncbi:hypothetical protein [Luteolibacter luteus]|uniref:Uncharacterized protein n=1 Tax=Luteolibacter luteus TaxID=2728835 RepID=A0A858RIT3_9BACT|nr:hypothetical protein [Luteolibacter luteus]QJE95963.1 hypothetical protein HHL09_09270 [Luteolibacter luteus]